MKAALPKISVICTCFNHAHYVIESMQSVLSQTYKNYELIVVDDKSTDESPSIIEKVQKQHPEITFIRLEKNEGICKAFNTGFKICSGVFLIDLAADDILLPERLERRVKIFKTLDDSYGVIFGDAEWIDDQGEQLGLRYEEFPHNSVPQGKIYQPLIERYFICSPTIIFVDPLFGSARRDDETLTYEDFDFWIRSSRNFKYHYEQDVLVKKRKLTNSLSQNQFKIFNKHNYTTYTLYTKILDLIRQPRTGCTVKENPV